MNKLSNFYIQVSIVSVILALVVLILKFAVPSYYLAVDFLSILILWLTTMGLYWIVSKNYSPERPVSFINIFTSATIAKLFILMIYIFAYILTKGKSRVEFLTFMFAAYIIYTFFEVKFLIKHQKEVQK